MCYRIDLNDVIKVADFGLTRDVYSKNYFRQVSAEKEGEEGEGPVKLPVRWMALESLHDGIFTEKTDVVRAHGTFIAFSEYGLEKQFISWCI